MKVGVPPSETETLTHKEIVVVIASLSVRIRDASEGA